MQSHSVLLFLLVIVSLHELAALRCARKCLTGVVPLGTKHPFEVPCEIVDVDPTTTECTAALAIKLSQNLLLGYLDIQARTSNRSSSLQAALDFNLRSTTSMINYTCTTSDNCDQQFVVESVGSAMWAQLNETKTRAEITSLLFDPSFEQKNFTCANHVTCQRPYDNCQAHLIEDVSAAQPHTAEFDNNFNCTINHMTEIAVVQYSTRPAQNHTVATHVFCNTNRCNEREVVQKAFDIIQTEFILPFNYSQFIHDD